SPLLLSFQFQCSRLAYAFNLSLHDALPISEEREVPVVGDQRIPVRLDLLPRPIADLLLDVVRGGDGELDLEHHPQRTDRHLRRRSEEHTSELQSREKLVCRLLLVNKKTESE